MARGPGGGGPRIFDLPAFVDSLRLGAEVALTLTLRSKAARVSVRCAVVVAPDCYMVGRAMQPGFAPTDAVLAALGWGNLESIFGAIHEGQECEGVVDMWGPDDEEEAGWRCRWLLHVPAKFRCGRAA